MRVEDGKLCERNQRSSDDVMVKPLTSSILGNHMLDPVMQQWPDPPLRSLISTHPQCGVSATVREPTNPLHGRPRDGLFWDAKALNYTGQSTASYEPICVHLPRYEVNHIHDTSPSVNEWKQTLI